jgi:hypothetical protein
MHSHPLKKGVDRITQFETLPVPILAVLKLENKEMKEGTMQRYGKQSSLW